jgi:hypothetical protein
MHSQSRNFSAILFSRVTNAMPLAGLREFCRTPQAPGAPGAFYSTQRTSAVGPPCCRGPEPISLLLTRAAEVDRNLPSMSREGQLTTLALDLPHRDRWGGTKRAVAPAHCQ